MPFRFTPIGAFFGRRKSRSKSSKGGTTGQGSNGGGSHTIFGGKPPVSRKRRKYAKKSSFKKLKLAVSKLTKNAPRDATLRHIQYRVKQPTSASNSSNHSHLTLLTPAIIEGVINELTYFDEAAPAVAVAVNASTIIYPTKLPVEFFFEATYRNNYTSPANMVVYWVRPKDIINIAPSDAAYATEAAKMEPPGNASLANFATDPQSFYTTLKRWKNDWEIIKSHKVRLDPGSEYKCYHSIRHIYDQEVVDEKTSEYHQNNSIILFTRTQGVVAHSVTTPTNVGFSDTMVDCVVKIIGKVRYPAGFPFITAEHQNTLLGVQTGGSTCVVADLN